MSATSTVTPAPGRGGFWLFFTVTSAAAGQIPVFICFFLFFVFLLKGDVISRVACSRSCFLSRVAFCGTDVLARYRVCVGYIPRSKSFKGTRPFEDAG